MSEEEDGRAKMGSSRTITVMPSVLSASGHTLSTPQTRHSASSLQCFSFASPVLFPGIPVPNNSLSSPRRSLLLTGNASHAVLAVSEGLCLC